MCILSGKRNVQLKKTLVVCWNKRFACEPPHSMHIKLPSLFQCVSIVFNTSCLSVGNALVPGSPLLVCPHVLSGLVRVNLTTPR